MLRALALVDDLMVLSRIRAAAAPAGVEVQVARSLPELLEACRPDPPALLILDLDSPRLPVLAALAALRQEPLGAGVPALGFFSHVEPERARSALAAGCERVWPRSRLVSELAELLRTLPG